MKDGFALSIFGECSVYPMDGYAAPLHASKIGHLAFGELMYGDFKPVAHLVGCGVAADVFGDVFVFETVVGELFFAEAVLQQGANFFD